MVDESVPFSEWRTNQDFEYARTQSAVIDYINTFVDYEALDDTQSGWEQEFESVSQIDTDSDKFETASTHITAYINR